MIVNHIRRSLIPIISEFIFRDNDLNSGHIADLRDFHVDRLCEVGALLPRKTDLEATSQLSFRQII